LMTAAVSQVVVVFRVCGVRDGKDRVGNRWVVVIQGKRIIYGVAPRVDMYHLMVCKYKGLG
jgi:hypothetical protein